MPTYQYRCTECDHDLEAVQKFTDDALTECPECRGRLRKIFNAVGVVFKGSGFYKTDSRSSGGSTNKSGSSSATTSSESASSSSSDASATNTSDSSSTGGSSTSGSSN
ncbi:FmdB family zinc ribbon protein [Propioniferax innocua]|uniref:Putative FmdB family regulatory protein n=1 Tax=Propioniferax innocua TaxID=1753 RepID=A0A542ZC98_9ACTN|nr:FmdB family zinc ribbon protein [Propioniferax innocua]TQL57909.1 putative FmdB family regulatory protein [Propioniferax innocua]